MNRNSILRRMQLPIDLTALLDVIFIVLLIVICNGQRLAVSSETAAAESLQAAQAAEAEAEAMRALYADRLETEEHIGTYVRLLTVYVDYEPGAPRNRNIRLLDDAGEVTAIALTPQTEEAALRSLEETLRTQIGDADKKPVILSLNLDRILYRDEEAVQTILDGLQSDYDNLWLK